MAAPVEEHCPTCGAKWVPIQWGLPVDGVRVAAEAGLVALGGCFTQDDGTDPRWQCPNEHRWTNGRRDERRSQAAVLEACAGTG